MSQIDKSFTKNHPKVYNSRRERQFKSVESEINKIINENDYIESKRRKLRNFNMNSHKNVKGSTISIGDICKLKGINL